MPPPRTAEPPVIVIPSSASDPPSMSKTRLLRPPLIVSSRAPGPTIVVVAGFAVSSRSPLVRVIVCGVSNRLEKTIVSPPPSVFAWLIAARSEPAPLSLVLLTESVESSARPSSAITIGRSRRLLLALVPRRRHRSVFTSDTSHDMFSCKLNRPPRRPAARPKTTCRTASVPLSSRMPPPRSARPRVIVTSCSH